MNKKVVIVGSGLGGLQCGYILAKNGMEVTLLEHDTQVGGCLQSFRRGDILFDTGLHYVGGLREGESLYPLFKYFGLLDLPWQPLDNDCFDEVIIGDRSFPLAVGHDNFCQTLSQYFPHQTQQLKAYTDFLRNVGDHIYDAFQPKNAAEFYGSSLFAQSAYQFLTDTITDPLLQKVLAGASLKMELQKDTLPLYVFAQINNSFIQSAWRLRGGGQQIADHLGGDIISMGGVVRTSATVTAIAEENGKATGVWVNNEEFIPADYVVCDIHPKEVLLLLAQSQSLRNVYRRRINALQDTFGMFTANIRLKPDTMPYVNHNMYIHNASADLWQPDTTTPQSIMISFYPGQPALDILTPVTWQQVERWADKTAGKRGDDYVRFKEQIVEQCISMAEKRLPELRGSIDKIFTSTPLSYHHYTLTHQGSAFGIRKDWQSPATTVLTPRTPISNLFLTGQNLNLHGVLGVSMTSVFSTAQILGMNTLLQQININEAKG